MQVLGSGLFQGDLQTLDETVTQKSDAYRPCRLGQRSLRIVKAPAVQSYRHGELFGPSVVATPHELHVRDGAPAQGIIGSQIEDVISGPKQGQTLGQQLE
ncbi:MAG: hypothetical protein C4296_08945 [Gemmataceae bacterium]